MYSSHSRECEGVSKLSIGTVHVNCSKAATELSRGLQIWLKLEDFSSSIEHQQIFALLKCLEDTEFISTQFLFGSGTG